MTDDKKPDELNEDQLDNVAGGAGEEYGDDPARRELQRKLRQENRPVAPEGSEDEHAKDGDPDIPTD